MDTRWKRFKSSRVVKALLAVLFVMTMGAAGIIWGYTPAYGYIRAHTVKTYGMDALLADDFMGSEYLADRLNSNYYAARELYSCATGYQKEMIAGFDFPCEIVKHGNRVNNFDRYPPSVRNVVFTADEREGNLAEVRINVVNTGINREGDSIFIGFTDRQFNEMSNYWHEMRHNMTVVMITELCLICAAIALLVLCCIVMSERSGEERVHPFFKLPYEITLLIMIPSFAGSVIPLFGIINRYDMENFCNSFNSRAIYMVLCGLCTAACAFIAWYLCACFAVRHSVKQARKGSVLYYVFIAVRFLLKKLFAFLLYIGKAVLRLIVFIKELFTGEAYRATAAKKILIIDLLAFMIALITIPLGIIFINDRANFLGAVFVVLGFSAAMTGMLGKYFILRDSAELEAQIKRMYSGDYSVKVQSMAKNSPYKPSSEMLSEMSEQYRRGIEESVKAERMKMELVTNVSHDLKTPLTSIIGYIELLSKEELPPEAEEHVRILKSKSERLKNIVADVFELAKTTSGEITVEREPLDLTKLSYQTLAEMEDRIADAGFDIKVNICEPPVTVVSDGKRLYRVIQNLLDNALKYSMKGTRIYYSLDVKDSRAYIVIKNIAAYEMTFTKEEILERFTRGDKARSSEGSGLGLSIAQGFALACGGQFDIDIDGDMFKSIVSFPVAAVNTESAEESAAVTVDG